MSPCFADRVVWSTGQVERSGVVEKVFRDGRIMDVGDMLVRCDKTNELVVVNQDDPSIDLVEQSFYSRERI